MAGGVATALADAVAPRRARARRRPRAVRGRRVLARRRWSRSSSRARCCSATCSATSSTATASWRRSPTAGPPSWPRARAGTALVLNADDPLVADLGRHAPTPSYFGVEDDALALPELQHASDSKHCRRCGHAYVYEAVYLAHLGHYHCPNCGSAPPGARPWPPTDVELRGIRSRRVHAAHARRARARRAAAARPLQRLQRARRRRAVPRARRRARRRRRRPGGGRARVRPRRDARPRRPPDLDPAGQEPGRRQRGAAHARARGRRARPASACSTTASPTAATSRGSGTPTGSCSPPHVRAHDLLRHARRRAGAADEVRGRGRRRACTSSTTSSRARRARSPTATARSTRSPPTPRCSSCASCWPRRGQAEEYWR